MREPLRELALLTLALHKRFCAVGHGEDAEADEIRDRMDPYWDLCTEDERTLCANLSHDLFLIEGKEPWLVEKVVLSPEKAVKQLEDCRQKSDWYAFLEVLRQRPKGLWADFEVGYFRAEAYQQLGYPEEIPAAFKTFAAIAEVSKLHYGNSR